VTLDPVLRLQQHQENILDFGKEHSFSILSHHRQMMIGCAVGKQSYRHTRKKALEKAGYPVFHRPKKKQISQKTQFISKANITKLKDGWMSLEKQRKKMSGSIRTGNMRNIRPDQNEDFIFSEIPNQTITDTSNYDKSLAISIQDSDEYSSILDASVDSSEIEFGQWDTPQDLSNSKPSNNTLSNSTPTTTSENLSFPFSDYEEDILLIKITLDNPSPSEPVLLYYSKTESVEHFREHLYTHPKLATLVNYNINEIQLFSQETQLELFQKLGCYQDLTEICVRKSNSVSL